MTFQEFFQRATQSESEPDGRTPYPYQRRFAESDPLQHLIQAPTGVGKTATAIVGWLWRWMANKADTPRRLIYCLPMRVLVEQTREEAQKWLKNLSLDEKVRVHVLMGGEETEEWDLEPEKPAVLIGTQDMLLSRALNRGYGMSRFRWPMHFGLLNNDCLWVLDEIQLMGSGLATSTQLQAFRELLLTFGTAKTVWMSATLLPRWLASVDFRDRIEPELRLKTLRLDPQTDYQADGLRQCWNAAKPLTAANLIADNTAEVAAFVREHHREGSLTLVIVNTVDRCRELFEAIQRCYAPSRPKGRGKKVAPSAPMPIPDLKMIHSRFRPKEREEWRDWLRQDAESLRKKHPMGQIIVSTQVVEAGVDLSARTLVTELAPWPSLVQRFGRCNRRGEFLAPDNPAHVFWVDVPSPDEKKAAPYSKEELDAAREQMDRITDVDLKSITTFFDGLNCKERAKLFPFDPLHVIRQKDFIDLFDTTPDLAGNDIDVSRFIRDGDDIDVQVFWRANVPDIQWTKAEIRRQWPRREELCSVSFVRFRDDFLRKDKKVYRWDALDGRWNSITKVDADSVYPGQVYWVQASEGGYDAKTGWEPGVKVVDPRLILPLPDPNEAPKPEAGYDDDDYSRYESSWQTVAEHTQQVFDTFEMLAETLPLTDEMRLALTIATRWHDWGKAHGTFQDAIKKPSGWEAGTFLAKAPDGCWARYKRKHFRHELASVLGILTLLKYGQAPKEWAELHPLLQNLALFLIAAHHGKVRLSIRSMPDEKMPDTPDALYARGVWQDDPLPAVDLGDGVRAPALAKIDLSPMLLGRVDGQPSWAERMLRLRDSKEFGPLKLAYLEAVLRAADMRASKAADEKAKQPKEVES